MEGYNYVVSLIACLKQDLRGLNGRSEGGADKIKSQDDHRRDVQRDFPPMQVAQAWALPAAWMASGANAAAGLGREQHDLTEN